MSRIFISHSSKDRAFVEQHIVNPLKAIRYEPWYSSDSIRGADDWARAILGGLSASKWFFLAMSPQSAASEYVRDEVAWAIEERPKHLLPLLIEDCNMRDFHLRIPRIQYIDFRQNPALAFSNVKTVLSASERTKAVTTALLQKSDKGHQHDFWLPLSEGGLQIVLGRFTQFSHFEKSGLLGFGDAAAMVELRSHLESLLIHKTAVTFADRLAGESLQTNLVLLGGPDANAVSAKALSIHETNFQWEFPGAGRIELIDLRTRERYIPKPKTDYGLICRAKNPFNPSKTIIFAAGAHGFGTWAAVRYLISDEFIMAKAVREQLEVECLVECDIAWEMPHNVRRRILRSSISKAARRRR
jgi:hypothetical protein